MRYLLVITKDPDTDYSGCFPDAPGCYAIGESAEEVKWRAADSLIDHLAGEPPPRPRDLQALVTDSEAGLTDSSVVALTWVEYEPEPAAAVAA
ncbi:MAG: putative RNase H-like HicB family nuclease [Verrucomicrobiales bacterium]|jgi:predicted RNase H-like HicB family nuclease